MYVCKEKESLKNHTYIYVTDPLKNITKTNFNRCPDASEVKLEIMTDRTDRPTDRQTDRPTGKPMDRPGQRKVSLLILTICLFVWLIILFYNLLYMYIFSKNFLMKICYTLLFVNTYKAAIVDSYELWYRIPISSQGVSCRNVNLVVFIHFSYWQKKA